jgi:hypothetical protein
MWKTGIFLPGLIALLAALPGCANDIDQQCPQGSQPVVRYEMFFGLDHSDGRSVSPEEWDKFLADTITPRFPLGLSVLEVKGQWQRPDGVVERENTKLVVLVKPPPLADGMILINEISREYQHRFNQDPVFRSINQNECVGLYSE